MLKLDAESTVEAKQSFERAMNAHGLKVSHYHADNGLFDTKTFKASVQHFQLSNRWDESPDNRR